jgi:hypothetical protein
MHDFHWVALGRIDLHGPAIGTAPSILSVGTFASPKFEKPQPMA